MNDRLIKLENKSDPSAPTVVSLTGLKRTIIYEKIKEGRFPAPIHIGARAVAWSMAEVTAWVEARKAARSVQARGEALA